MRRIFAVLLSSALLLAMATFPAEAAETPTFEDYTIEYSDVDTFTSDADIASGYAKEGNVTIANNVVTVAGNGSKNGLLCKTGLAGITAIEVVLKVTGGNTDVAFTNSVLTHAALGIQLSSTSYSIYGSLSSASSWLNSTKIASGSVSSSGTVTILYIADTANSQAFISVNGTVHTIALSATNSLPQTSINNATTNFSAVKIMTTSTSTSSKVEVSSIKVGTASTVSIEQTGSHGVEIMVKNHYATVYSVDLSFGDFAFTYTPADATTSAKWEGNDGENNLISVINRSNAAVRVNVTSEMNADLNGVTLKMNADLNGVTFEWDGALTAVLASAEGLATPESLSLTATIGGTPGRSYVSDGKTQTKIGSIKITVRPA